MINQKIKIGDLFYCKNGGPLMMTEMEPINNRGELTYLNLVWFDSANRMQRTTLSIECLITEKEAIANWEAERAEALEKHKKNIFSLAGRFDFSGGKDDVIKEPS